MITGQIFHRLTVVGPTERKVGNKTIYECLCSCGNTAYTDKYKLTSGHTKSCGCFKLENLSEIKFKHGLIFTPEYNAWSEMKQRCLNQNIKSYKHYGGRGISVCERWIHSFENFLDDMNQRPTSKHSIDRIDVNGNYEPTNCRWATATEQAANRRTTTKFLFHGEMIALSHIAKYLGISQQTMQRLVMVKKMSIESIISTRL
jgi:hypothetical protein